MKKNYIVLLMVAFFATKSKGQAVLDTLTFEPLLSQVDTFWNGSDLSGGFNCPSSNYNPHFNNSFDTTWMSWEGFSYSSMTDSVTTGWTNQYSCIAGAGADNSKNYAVGYIGYTTIPTIEFPIPVVAQRAQSNFINGLYVNNSTYAYYSMLNGDLVGKKFGDTIGPGDTVADGTNGEDWFKLTIYNYIDGDSVEFYLADYRFANDSLDYIVKDWTWVDLSSFNNPFYITFKLSSSDNGNWGMNTPAYFCLDNIVVDPSKYPSSISELNNIEIAVYPNPTADYITINADIEGSYNLELYNSNGQLVSKLNNLYQNNKIVSLIDMPKGNYMLRLISDKGIASKQIIKL